MRRSLKLHCVAIAFFLSGIGAADEVSEAVSRCLVAARAEAHRAEVAALGAPPKKLGSWSCTTGGCVPHSVALFRALGGRDRWKIIDGNTRDSQISVDGKPQRLDARHIFLVEAASEGKPDEIILDSTYLQYLRGGDKLDVPRIFIGTRADLVRFFTDHRDRIDPKFIRDGVRGRIDPEEFVDAHYGYGRFARNREDGTSAYTAMFPEEK